jgi:hypothetical protein
VLVECLLQTLKACGVCAHGTALFLQDDVLGGCWAHHFREPPEMGWAPAGPAAGAASVSEHKGFETELGVFASADGIFTGPTEIANGGICDLGHIHRRESARAGQAGQGHGVPAVSVDAIARFVGNQ